MLPVRAPARAALVLWVAGCARGPAAPTTPLPVASADTAARDSTRQAGRLPPAAAVRGPLALRVVYPSPDAVVAARDSSFIFGSAGTGEARITINGQPVQVWPNGAWLAWVSLPPDSLMRFRIDATTDSASQTLDYTLRRGDYRPPPPLAPVWIDTTSFMPRGALWWPRDEYVALSVRVSEGALVRMRLPDGTLVPLAPAPAREPVPGAVRAFDRDLTKLSTPLVRERYAGVLRGRAIGPDPGSVFPPPVSPVLATAPVATPITCGSAPCRPLGMSAPSPDSLWGTLEAIRGSDTARARWPLQIALLDSMPLVAELADTDSVVVGRAVPGGTYHWFFPQGTRATVAGRANDDLRLHLSPSARAWVSVENAHRAFEGIVSPAVVGSLTLSPRADRVTARIPVTRRVPFQVTEGERSLVVRLYGTVGDVNWIRYGETDSLVERVTWSQATAGEVTLTFDLVSPVWGYRARWDRGDLLLDIRRPPPLESSHPLRGRLIAVDAGHPPAGATGPTGLREAEANLGVALELQRMLEEQGAKVLMTRTADTPLDLGSRVRLAEAGGADLLISIHNNALPDGINPFTSNGTSTYYNHPRSIPLARAIQHQLVRRLGLRDLGVGRGDLALVRGTWLPSVLTEGMFMIVPDQEAALRTLEGRRLYAVAILEGIREFLQERSRMD
jgi:N-acetylmuramoyl-L-alanine amidase